MAKTVPEEGMYKLIVPYQSRRESFNTLTPPYLRCYIRKNQRDLKWQKKEAMEIRAVIYEAENN